MRTNSINANNDFAKDLRGINRKVKLETFTTPTNSVYGAMQDGYVDRFDQKISPRPSFPKRGGNNFPLW